MHRGAFVLVVIAVGLATAAWRRVSPAGRVVVVRMVDVSPTEFRFEPAAVTVAPGDTVRFEQTTVMPHNVEFRDVPDGTNLGAAQMGPFLTKPGETYDVVINSRFAAGVHHYVCTPHELLGMKGTLTVAAP